MQLVKVPAVMCNLWSVSPLKDAMCLAATYSFLHQLYLQREMEVTIHWSFFGTFDSKLRHPAWWAYFWCSKQCSLAINVGMRFQNRSIAYRCINIQETILGSKYDLYYMESTSTLMSTYYWQITMSTIVFQRTIYQASFSASDFESYLSINL